MFSSKKNNPFSLKIYRIATYLLYAKYYSAFDACISRRRRD